METKPTGATLLRRLTEKSTLNFGKHHNIPIFKMLERANLKAYLMWVYYNNSAIDFTENVLIELNITGDRVIQKPGKDPEKFDQIQKKIAKWKFATRGFIVVGQKKAAQKRKLTAQECLRHLSKSSLMAKNHGR